MKIAHVLTYVSADGAFGGPVAVASLQAEELARRGHEVELLAGWDGKASLKIPGVRTRLFRTRRYAPLGFSGLAAPGLLRYLRRHASEFDVVHIHLARDSITMPASLLALRQGARVVVQPHGMVSPDSRFRARVLDSLMTRRILHQASSVLALTTVEANALAVVSRNRARIARIANGIRLSDTTPIAKSEPPEVLFLARLHPRKRVKAFLDMARSLIAQGVHARFVIVGPDEGDLAHVQATISSPQLRDHIAYEGALPAGQGAERIARATVYVLPSVGEVFPMTVLEAMSVGTACVITDDNGLAEEVVSRRAGIVTNGTSEELAIAVMTLVADAPLRSELCRAAAEMIVDLLSIESVAISLEAAYASEATVGAR